MEDNERLGVRLPLGRRGREPGRLWLEPIGPNTLRLSDPLLLECGGGEEDRGRGVAGEGMVLMAKRRCVCVASNTHHFSIWLFLRLQTSKREFSQLSITYVGSNEIKKIIGEIILLFQKKIMSN